MRLRSMCRCSDLRDGGVIPDNVRPSGRTVTGRRGNGYHCRVSPLNWRCTGAEESSMGGRHTAPNPGTDAFMALIILVLLAVLAAVIIPAALGH